MECERESRNGLYATPVKLKIPVFQIVVPDALIQKKIFPSATSPDLTLYSAGSQTKNR